MDVFLVCVSYSCVELSCVRVQDHLQGMRRFVAHGLRWWPSQCAEPQSSCGRCSRSQLGEWRAWRWSAWMRPRHAGVPASSCGSCGSWMAVRGGPSSMRSESICRLSSLVPGAAVCVCFVKSQEKPTYGRSSAGAFVAILSAHCSVSSSRCCREWEWESSCSWATPTVLESGVLSLICTEHKFFWD